MQTTDLSILIQHTERCSFLARKRRDDLSLARIADDNMDWLLIFPFHKFHIPSFLKTDRKKL